MKGLFGLHRARYFGLAKTHAQMTMAAIAANLTKATNKVKIAETLHSIHQNFKTCRK